MATMVQDSPSRHQDQFVLRMPDGMRERIMESAKANNRSMNSEIVAILEKAFLPSLSARLRELLDQVNGARNPSVLTPSKVAELIGETDASDVENAFAGKGGLTFAKIESIARIWGARLDWLKHGGGAMFPVERGHGFTVEMAHNFLISKAEKLSLLRSESKYGEIAAVIDNGDGAFKVIQTGLNLSENIGSGGEADNAHFSNACLYLWQNCKNKFSGYLLEDESFTSLVRGDVYPGVILNRAAHSTWADEWWNERQFDTSRPDEYWPGYKTFCVRINRCIQKDKEFKREREDIVSGAWKLPADSGIIHYNPD